MSNLGVGVAIVEILNFLAKLFTNFDRADDFAVFTVGKDFSEKPESTVDSSNNSAYWNFLGEDFIKDVVGFAAVAKS